MHTQTWTGRCPCSCTCLQTHKRTRELYVGHQRDRPGVAQGCPTPFQKSMTKQDLRSAGWSPVSVARLAAAQTWRCTGTGAHLRFAGLDWKLSSACTEESGWGLFEHMRTRGAATPLTPEASLISGLPGFWARGRADLERPDHGRASAQAHGG